MPRSTDPGFRSPGRRWIERALFLAVFSSSFVLAGSPEFGSRGLIEYQPGSLPIIIGAPHGGLLKPAAMPDRTYGVLDQDRNTQELARLLHAALLKRTGGSPHLILCLLHRSKLDCNREIVEATQGAEQARQSWQDWHNFIARSKSTVLEQFGAGLYLDVHGHQHKEGRIELGYMVSPEKLRQADEQLDNDRLAIHASSIRELDQRSPASFASLLRGPSSLGALLEACGYPSVPSPKFPSPGEKELYFRGGFNTDTHGSRTGGTISAIQIECPYDGVRDTVLNRAKFIDVLSEALTVWYKTHYGILLAPIQPTPKSPSP